MGPATEFNKDFACQWYEGLHCLWISQQSTIKEDWEHLASIKQHAKWLFHTDCYLVSHNMTEFLVVTSVLCSATLLDRSCMFDMSNEPITKQNIKENKDMKVYKETDVCNSFSVIYGN